MLVDPSLLEAHLTVATFEASFRWCASQTHAHAHVVLDARGLRSVDRRDLHVVPQRLWRRGAPDFGHEGGRVGSQPHPVRACAGHALFAGSVCLLSCARTWLQALSVCWVAQTLVAGSVCLLGCARTHELMIRSREGLRWPLITGQCSCVCETHAGNWARGCGFHLCLEAMRTSASLSACLSSASTCVRTFCGGRVSVCAARL
jgi:hypothetical protein